MLLSCDLGAIMGVILSATRKLDAATSYIKMTAQLSLQTNDAPPSYCRDAQTCVMLLRSCSIFSQRHLSYDVSHVSQTAATAAHAVENH